MTLIRDYDELMTALRARINEIGISQSDLEALTGLATGHVGKLLGPVRVKNIGLHSLFLLLGGLALRMRFEVDLEAAQRMEARWVRRDEIRRRPGSIRRQFSPELRAKIWHEGAGVVGSRGGHARAVCLPAKQRTQIARRAARARWKKAREMGANRA